jgi:DUF4097 and DUF4098 domain-containing protein YvlB
MQRTFEVHGPAELEVRLASGEIDVQTTADASVEVELIAHDEESQQLVDAARVELQDHHGRPRLTVDVPGRRSGGFNLGFFFGRQGITCRIRTPHGSPLSVRTKSADVSARGTLGSVNIASGSGDVDLPQVDGQVSVKAASGDVRVGAVSAGVSVQTASGDVEIASAQGVISVNTASGDVTIGEAYDDVSTNTVSGDQNHRAVLRGTISAHSVSGDVKIGVRRGSKVFLDCNTVSGDTSSELEVSPESPSGDGPLVEVRAKTVSGDIQITRAAALTTEPPGGSASGELTTANDTPPPTDSSQEVHA